jgi:hemolysin D
MLDSIGLLWLYAGALAACAIAAVVYRVKFRRPSGEPHNMPPMGSVGRAVLGQPAEPDRPATPADSPSAPASPGAAPATPAQPTTGEAPGWTMPRILATPARILSDQSREPPSIVTDEKDEKPATGPNPAPSAKKSVRFTTDTEFLPAALEIVETPPSPVATTLMLGICAAFSLALLWSIVGKLDIHAVAQGKIQPSGRTKVVQPLEPGRIAAIHVEAGQSVTEGDVLVELDPTDTAADLEALTRELESTAAEHIRRLVAVSAARTPPSTPPPTNIDFPAIVGQKVRLRETALLAAELTQLRSTVEGFRTQIAERQATKQRLSASIAARKKVLDLSKERVGMREEIKTRGAGSRALIIEAELQYENIVTSDASERGQLMEADASIVSLEARMSQTVDQFAAEQVQKAAEAERRRDRLEQELIKARSKRDRTRLRAPSTGIVQQIEVTTLGQVVASGQSLMSVVPADAPLEVEAMVANKDIGFVSKGQKATVKIEAFPFTRFGTIDAEVVKVSVDAIEERNATALMDASAAARPQGGGQSRSAPGQNLVFPATLRLDRRSIDVGGKAIPLTPGMAVTVEIKTGERRAISYILSPLGEILGASGNER